MSKHGIIGRVTQLARANVDAMIDSADDPQQMLDKLVREYQANIAEAEHAIAQLTGDLSIAEADQREDATAVGQWTKEAEEASQKADDLRATGEADGADRFDDLDVPLDAQSKLGEPPCGRHYLLFQRSDCLVERVDARA